MVIDRVIINPCKLQNHMLKRRLEKTCDFVPDIFETPLFQTSERAASAVGYPESPHNLRHSHTVRAPRDYNRPGGSVRASTKRFLVAHM